MHTHIHLFTKLNMCLLIIKYSTRVWGYIVEIDKTMISQVFTGSML